MLKGIAGHSGEEVSIKIQPSSLPGIHFVLPQGRVTANLDHVISTNMCTTIKQNEAYISTVEHFLSAVFALGVKNIDIIVLDGNEMPLMDGSALHFYEVLEEEGLYPIEPSEEDKDFIYDGPLIMVENERGFIEFTPHQDLVFDITVDKPFPEQNYIFNFTTDNYKKEIAPARTFGFYSDGEHLKKSGMALGSNFTNTVVLSDNGLVMNEEGMRFPEELARHKILDAIGDLRLLNIPIKGYFRAVNPGHTLNVELARCIRAEIPTNFLTKS